MDKLPKGEICYNFIDGTVTQNGSGYTYHLYSGHLNNGGTPGQLTDIDSAAFGGYSGTGNGNSETILLLVK